MNQPVKARTRLSRALLTAALVGGLLAGSVSVAYGDTLSDLQNKKNAASSQINSNNAKKAESQGAYNEATQRLVDANAELDAAQQVLAGVQAQLADAKAEDDRLAEELAAAQQQLEEAKAAVVAGEAALKKQQYRVANVVQSSAQQESPTLMVLGMLVNDSDGASINSRLQWNQALGEVSGNEMAKLTELQKQLEEAKRVATDLEAQVSEQKKQAEDHLAVTQDLVNQAAAAQNEVQKKVNAAAAAKQAAASDIAKIEAENAQLDQERNQFEAQIKAEIARQEEEAKKQQQGGGSSSGGGASNDRPASSNGFFQKPVNAPITSSYGWRKHPILGYNKLHDGTDFGAGCGVPIVAAESGTVTIAGPYSGLGNYVQINHGKINGNSYSTGYGHQSKLVVSKGQYVNRGQLIGYVGTTGMSTGCHLHFIVYRNGSTTDPVAYL